MEMFWFWAVAALLAVYVVLDGFDLGVGVLHLFVARNEEERRTVVRSIGPVWDGNEVWLLAAGGTLALAFPKVYASSFSGFYLPLMIVLWLLMLRALGLEFRHQIHHPMWTSFWDAAFSLASVLLTVFFGAALGNVVRGVPLDAEGYFFAPLWTTFTVSSEPGILDWFTVLMGIVALCTLTMHGGHYLAMKTQGAIRDRARAIAAYAFLCTLGGSLAAMAATSAIHPELWENFTAHPVSLAIPLGAAAGLIGGGIAARKGRDAGAFLGSTVFILGMLVATAFGLFPRLLPSSTDPALALTAYNSAAYGEGMRAALPWWGCGMALASLYTIFMYRSFRGKVAPGDDDHGY